MLTRFQLEDFRIVGHYLGLVLLLVGVSMLIPIFVAVIAREMEPLGDFILSMGITCLAGALLVLLKFRPNQLNGRQAILLTGLTWVFVSFFGTIPFFLSGHFSSFLNAFFESVSAFTTTGMSILEDPNHLAYSHGIWRMMTLLMGAQGIIAFAMTIGVFARSSGAGSLYKAEGRTDSVLPNIISTVRFSMGITFLFVSLGAIALVFVMLFNGAHFFRAAYHAVYLSGAAFATGGFAPMSTSIVYYHSPLLELIIMVLMISGAINFSLYFMIWNGHFEEIFHNVEIKALVFWVIVVTIILSAAFAGDKVLGESVGVLLRRGIFTVFAAITGAGFQIFYTSQFADASSAAVLFAIMIAMGFGGSTGSTSGGIKALRVAIIFKSVVADIKRALAPDRAVVRVKYHHLSDRILEANEVSSAMTVFLLYVITYLIGTMVYVFFGNSPIDAAFDSIAATSNAGMSSGVLSPDMPALMKFTFIIQMWGGRLEFIALLALFAGLYYTVKPVFKDGINRKKDGVRR
ncbi:MAG: potassium transporter TrkG [Coriobacteriia bacterium]|nr:potassium transporter TrkG [Coriobacteriia bacterium]